jgi:hypothetical protein
MNDFEIASASIGLIMEGFLSNISKQHPGNGGINSPSAECAVENKEYLGDGYCDGGDYNTAECNWDGGDCCEHTCRANNQGCPLDKMDCIGENEIVRVDNSFPCDMAKMDEFKRLFKGWHDALTDVNGQSTRDKCLQKDISADEHNHVIQAFNMGIVMQKGTAEMRSAQAKLGGPSVAIACELWSKQMGNGWFGTLITHEMGHVAGYSHPDWGPNMTFESQCLSPQSQMCPAGSCIEWIGACETHLNHGSTPCGDYNLGCKTTCVRGEYCNTLPEKITECFGYQKVHSRGESTSELGGDLLSNVGDQAGSKMCEWFGIGCKAAGELKITISFVLSLMSVLQYAKLL